jgi:hypothetical protein
VRLETVKQNGGAFMISAAPLLPAFNASGSDPILSTKSLVMLVAPVEGQPPITFTTPTI